jgi:leucyl aminopeptidase
VYRKVVPEDQLTGRESMLRMPLPEESGGLKENEMASIKDTHDRQDGVITAALFVAGFGIGGTETKEEV